METFYQLQNDRLTIYFSLDLNSYEKDILKKLNASRKDIILSKEYFKLNYNLRDEKSIENFLKKFRSKYIIIEDTQKKNKYFIPILEYFYFQENSFFLVFSSHIVKSFEAGTSLNKLGINNILIFSEKYTYKLFFLINSNTSSILKISLENFKEIFQIVNKYSRFYDMEKNIILPMINDINQNSNFFVSYNKLKKSNYHSSKITAIEFSIRKKRENSEEIILNEIMNSIKNRITNFTEIHSLIKNALLINGKSYIFKIIDAAFKNSTSNFENYLKNLLSQENKEEIPLKIIEVKAKSLFDIHTEIIEILKKYRNSKKISSLPFLINLYSLKDKDEIYLNYLGIFFKIIYNKDSISFIQILKI